MRTVMMAVTMDGVSYNERVTIISLAHFRGSLKTFEGRHTSIYATLHARVDDIPGERPLRPRMYFLFDGHNLFSAFMYKQSIDVNDNEARLVSTEILTVN